MMKEGIELMEAWGFKYKTIGFQWIKLNKKNGQKFASGSWFIAISTVLPNAISIPTLAPPPPAKAARQRAHNHAKKG